MNDAEFAKFVAQRLASERGEAEQDAGLFNFIRSINGINIAQSELAEELEAMFQSDSEVYNADAVLLAVGRVLYHAQGVLSASDLNLADAKRRFILEHGND